MRPFLARDHFLPPQGNGTRKYLHYQNGLFIDQFVNLLFPFNTLIQPLAAEKEKVENNQQEVKKGSCYEVLIHI